MDLSCPTQGEMCTFLTGCRSPLCTDCIHNRNQLGHYQAGLYFFFFGQAHMKVGTSTNPSNCEALLGVYEK